MHRCIKRKENVWCAEICVCAISMLTLPVPLFLSVYLSVNTTTHIVSDLKQNKKNSLSPQTVFSISIVVEPQVVYTSVSVVCTTQNPGLIHVFAAHDKCTNTIGWKL